MKADNTLTDLRDAANAQNADISCPTKQGPDQPSFQLTIFQMGGVFLLYGAAFALGLVVWVGEEVSHRSRVVSGHWWGGVMWAVVGCHLRHLSLSFIYSYFIVS